MSTITMPPVPAQVMMCAIEKLVQLMSARAPVGVPRSVAPKASHVSSMTLRPWRSATSRTTSQSGAFPARLGSRMARVRSVTSSSILAASVLKVFGAASTNTGTRPALHDRSDVGGEGEGRGDDLGAGLKIEQFDRQVQGGGAGVAHRTKLLARECGYSGLHRVDVLSDSETLVAAAQHVVDGLDLFLAVRSACVGDAVCGLCGRGVGGGHCFLRTSWGQWSAPRTRALCGTGEPPVTRTWSMALAGWLTDVPRTRRTPSAMPLTPWT